MNTSPGKVAYSSESDAPIPTATGKLRASLEDLASAVNTMEARLSPVVGRSNDPQGEPRLEALRDNGSPLAGELHGLKEHAMILRERLVSLLERLEI